MLGSLYDEMNPRDYRAEWKRNLARFFYESEPEDPTRTEWVHDYLIREAKSDLWCVQDMAVTPANKFTAAQEVILERIDIENRPDGTHVSVFFQDALTHTVRQYEWFNEQIRGYIKEINDPVTGIRRPGSRAYEYWKTLN